MNHPELMGPTPRSEPGKRKQRAWLAGGLAVAVAGIVIAATLTFGLPGSHRGGDPEGVRQQALRSISVALPGDAKIQIHSVGPPIWDSCGDRPGTHGWSDVVDFYQFTSARPPAKVVADAEARMKIAGWTLKSTSTTPLGPSAEWTKTVTGDVVASALLAVGTRGPSRHSPSFWDLTASAPPEGRRVSGC